MYQLPVENIEKIRKSRRKVKNILSELGLEDCQKLLKVGSPCLHMQAKHFSQKWHATCFYYILISRSHGVLLYGCFYTAVSGP